ncbi:MAG: xanthine dehydrogenase family protein subunit M, partial [Proteobacteria bacterium]|nr:xanthine dehydrogenase family protein subunit M [Pseudomonadota bacterium]
VAPIDRRATDAEQLREGRILTADLIDTAASAAVAASDPIDDIRASASYRRHTVHTLTRRLLGEAWARQSGGV